MDVLQAIRYIISSWNEVTVETIYNCWNHTGILPDNELLDDETDDETDDQMLNEIIRALNLPNAMRVNEFLNIPEEELYTKFLKMTKSLWNMWIFLKSLMKILMI